MDIRHRISCNSRKEEKFFGLIKKTGIKYKSIEMPGGKSQFVYFDITESDPNWPEVAQLVLAYKVVDIYDTFFSKTEVLSAEWARLISTYIEGYPQPFDTWVTNPINYKNNCRECGTFQQDSSFQIKQEPSLKGKDFMTLNWAVSAYFCTPRVLREFEAHQIKGYEGWNVIISKNQSPSQKIFQLFVSNVTSPGLLDASDLAPVICPKCHITRYSYHQRGMMQYERNALDPELDIVRTFEWFGSGRDAYQEVFVSNRVVKIIIDNGWKGVQFKVVKLI